MYPIYLYIPTCIVGFRLKSRLKLSYRPATRPHRVSTESIIEETSSKNEQEDDKDIPKCQNSTAEVPGIPLVLNLDTNIGDAQEDKTYYTL